jgi:hypothetical protein
MQEVGLDMDELIRLANPKMILELAAGINDPGDVIERYGVTPEQFGRLRDMPAFRSAYREAKAFWEGDSNYKERIAVKAGVMVEETLMDVYDIIKESDTHKSIRMDAFKTLAAMAGTDGKQKEAQHAGQRVNINIRLGNETPVAKVVEVTGHTIEGELE